MCPVCGELGRTRFKFEGNHIAIYGCKACGAEYAHPQPSDETLASIYSRDYFIGSEDERAANRVTELKGATAKLYLDAIARRTRPVGPRLLDVGCGSGDFLIEAQTRGFDVEGLEYSEHSTDVANARLSYKAVQTGSLETIRLPASSYHVITAFDVLEHVRNPAYALECLHSAMTPGGVLVIVTPSLDSWSRRLLGRYWMEYKTEHLTYFGRKSLSRLLERIGFTAIEFISNYKILSLDYIGQHFQRFPTPLVSPVVRFVLAILPAKLAHRKIRIIASGTMAFARKSA